MRIHLLRAMVSIQLSMDAKHGRCARGGEENGSV